MIAALVLAAQVASQAAEPPGMCLRARPLPACKGFFVTSAGLGVGGGLYIVPGGTVYADLLTLIVANDASTSDDDVFGTLGSC